MFSNPFILGVVATAVVAGLPFVHRISHQKEASAAAFENASQTFYRKATALLEGDDAVPERIVQVLATAGDVLSSPQRTRRIARRVANESGSMSAKQRSEWNVALESMSDTQRQMYYEAMAAHLDAILHSTVRYHDKILDVLYSAAKQRPHSKFSATEANLGATALDYTTTCGAAA